MMGIKVGIDLGTTYSAVAIFDEEKGQPVIIPNTFGKHTTPSVIQFLENGEIIVGDEALEAFEAGEYGCTSAFKRSMGDKESYCSFYGKDYTAEDLSTIMLRHLKEEAEAVTQKTIEEVVVTVPAYFYHKKRQDTIRAAERAGLKVRQIINEPTAAALNYGVNHWRENARVLVYDLGGGTFDVTLVQMYKNNHMRSLQTLGNHSIGGKDWDNRICKLIEEKINIEIDLDVSDNPEIHKIVMQSAENIKKQLTERLTADVTLYIPDYGRFSTSVSLEEFNENTKDLLIETGNLCENLLKGLGIDWKDITDILLVGGSTKMKQVSEYLEQISGHKPLMQVNPDEAVALGAAIQVHLPLPKYNVLTLGDTESNDIISVGQQAIKNQNTSQGEVGKEIALKNALSVSQEDVVAHAMGVIAVNAEGTKYINKTIIPANQRIPVKFAEGFHYYTSSSADNEVEIYVLQGVKSPLESEIIGKYVVSGIEHDKNENPTIITIQYSYDVNGMVHVQARQGDSLVDLPIREEPIPEDMSKFGRPIDPEEFKPIAEPLSVMMAIDVSGSMTGEPMIAAKNAMSHFVDRVKDYPGEVEIGVIAVSDTSEVVQNLTTNLRLCKKSIQSITECMTGIGNSGHPFNDIQNSLGNVEGRRIGIVLADGIWCDQLLAVREARNCHQMGIDIIGRGFGQANEEFLRAITSGDIDSMFVEQSELTRSFGKIAQEIVQASVYGQVRRKDQAITAQTWLAINESEE